ncbi:ABC transporter substrate-binding protein [bacterium]|nr:ABC transporter substrate-binding protein [bacterium]
MSRKPAEEEVIKIGFVGTLSGDAANYGQSELNAIELAVEEINNDGGINGRQLELIPEDGKGEAQAAVTAIQKLINIDGVKVVLGGTTSAETLAMAPIAERNKVILFSSYASNPAISEAGDFVFRNGPRDDDAGRFLAQLAFDRGHRKAAILAESSDVTIGLRDVFKEKFEQLRGKIVSDELFGLGEKDYRTQLIKIKASNPDLIFLGAYSGITGGLAAKQIREMKIDVPILSTWVFSGEDALKSAGSAAEGIIFEDVPVLDLKNPKAKIFVDKYTARYGQPASDWDAGASYDRVYIIADALKKCGENTECIRDYLYGLEEYDGVIGKYRFDSNGDVVGIGFAIKKIINGKPELIE